MLWNETLFGLTAGNFAMLVIGIVLLLAWFIFQTKKAQPTWAGKIDRLANILFPLPPLVLALAGAHPFQTLMLAVVCFGTHYGLTRNNDLLPALFGTLIGSLIGASTGSWFAFWLFLILGYGAAYLQVVIAIFRGVRSITLPAWIQQMNPVHIFFERRKFFTKVETDAVLTADQLKQLKKSSDIRHDILSNPALAAYATEFPSLMMAPWKRKLIRFTFFVLVAVIGMFLCYTVTFGGPSFLNAVQQVPAFQGMAVDDCSDGGLGCSNQQGTVPPTETPFPTNTPAPTYTSVDPCNGRGTDPSGNCLTRAQVEQTAQANIPSATPFVPTTVPTIAPTFTPIVLPSNTPIPTQESSPTAVGACC